MTDLTSLYVLAALTSAAGLLSLAARIAWQRHRTNAAWREAQRIDDLRLLSVREAMFCHAGADISVWATVQIDRAGMVRVARHAERVLVSAA